MIPVSFVFAFFGLFFASIFDIRTREIPDWLSYSMIALGFGTALIASILYKDFYPIVYSIIGFAIGFVLAWIFYKTNQWGGGDSKALMGLGALVGFNFNEGLPLFLILLLNIFIIGALYGFLWSVFLALKNFKMFKRAFRDYQLSENITKVRRMVVIATIVGLVAAIFTDSFNRLFFISVSALIFFMFHFFVFTKAVEKSCMEKNIPISKLTEGDWVLETVSVNGKVLCTPKNPVTKEELASLLKFKSQHKKSKILMREGIPFLPSFFIAFIFTLLLGNWLLFFI
ncbi:MAG: A24 family peptidase [Nanoarchaeota archaeon]|nr:A24 family peptidase [Nanoarchaeota archaeon]MBU1269791.1 A24 family peptidase [Nanoarchaeota archaeon]MBU1604383.1 A24 family peptidase [Nanoarchaeota archaeon]MBU2443760.1 A24 family peptidase [Nanoarchaeota archaeon]